MPRYRYLACAALFCSLQACGGTASTAPDSSSTAADKPADESACPTYATRLCEQLGPRSDSCRSVMGVVVFMPPRACVAGLEEFDQTLERIAKLRGACDTVVQKVCAAMGEESEACDAISADLPQVPPGHCAALLRDHEQLIAALQAREAAHGPVSEEAWQQLVADTAPSFGSADAKVVVVEFSDFECPFCAQAAETLAKLKSEYSERVRVVFRQYPLPFHPNARGAAQAALAAHDQGRFWDYHDVLFDNQDSLEAPALADYAKKVGLDMDAFNAAAKADQTASRVAQDIKLGDSVQVRGTPTMFINKQRVDNPIDYDAVSAEIDEALEAAQEPAQAPTQQQATEEPAAP